MSDEKTPPKPVVILDATIENEGGNGIDADVPVHIERLSLKNKGGHGVVLRASNSTIIGGVIDGDREPKPERDKPARDGAISVAAAVTAAAIAKAMGLN